MLYHTWCSSCHGANVHSGSAVPDLKYLPAASHSRWNLIVREGVYETVGMPGFKAILSEAAARAVHGYVVHRTKIAIAECESDYPARYPEVFGTACAKRGRRQPVGAGLAPRPSSRSCGRWSEGDTIRCGSLAKKGGQQGPPLRFDFRMNFNRLRMSFDASSNPGPRRLRTGNRRPVFTGVAAKRRRGGACSPARPRDHGALARRATRSGAVRWRKRAANKGRPYGSIFVCISTACGFCSMRGRRLRPCALRRGLLHVDVRHWHESVAEHVDGGLGLLQDHVTEQRFRFFRPRPRLPGRQPRSRPVGIRQS